MATVAELVLLRARVARLRRGRDRWKAKALGHAIVLPGAHMWDPLVERWRSLTHYWLGVEGGDRYLQDPGPTLDLMLGICQHVSGGNPLSVCHKEWVGEPPPGYDPADDSTKASGLFDHLPAYWEARSRGAGFEGASIFNPNANIAVACSMLWAGWPESMPAPHWHHWSGAHVSAEGSYEWALSQLSGQ